jgi:hypothetical protein
LSSGKRSKPSGKVSFRTTESKQACDYQDLRIFALTSPKCSESFSGESFAFS